MSDVNQAKQDMKEAAEILAMHEEAWKRSFGRLMSSELPDAMHKFYQSESDGGASPVDGLLATIHFGALMASSIVRMSGDKRAVAEAAGDAFKEAIKRYSFVP